jgi:hypothetical protein
MITLNLKKLLDTGCHIYYQNHFNTLMSHMGKTWETIDNTEISLLDIVRLTDIEFGIDCMEATPEHHKMWRQFGLWCIQPVVFLISIPSCREAYETSIKFINDEVSIEVLKEKHYKAACEQNIYSEGNYYVHFSSDEMALNFSEPYFFDCAYKCYNHYPQAMNPLGISFDYAQKKINKKFIEIIS